MSSFWDKGNTWLDQIMYVTRFPYMSWDRFTSEVPFESVSWQRRGIRLLSWGTRFDMNHRLLQIVFLVTNPDIEFFSWEIIVKDEETESIQKWLTERKPEFWNF